MAKKHEKVSKVENLVVTTVSDTSFTCEGITFIGANEDETDAIADSIKTKKKPTDIYTYTLNGDGTITIVKGNTGTYRLSGRLAFLSS